MKKVGLFIDTWYPMVDGVIKVVDNYARRLVQYCEVVVFCPEVRGYRREADEGLPYKVVRCHSLPLLHNDYDIPAPALDPHFEAQLIRSGINLYLDDFGTGYSNIERLATYRFHTIKFDKSLLYKAMESEKLDEMLSAMASMLKNDDHEILVEGVETEEQSRYSIERGFNEIQGFKYAKPAPIEELVNYFGRKDAKSV